MAILVNGGALSHSPLLNVEPFPNERWGEGFRALAAELGRLVFACKPDFIALTVQDRLRTLFYDLMPMALRPYRITKGGGEAQLDSIDMNKVTCDGQAIRPMLAAVSRVTVVGCGAISASSFSKSAEAGTCANMDKCTGTNPKAIGVIEAATKVPALFGSCSQEICPHYGGHLGRRARTKSHCARQGRHGSRSRAQVHSRRARYSLSQLPHAEVLV